MAILRVTVSSLITKARSSSTTTPVIPQYPKFTTTFPKTMTSSTFNDFSLPPPQPCFEPINLEKINYPNNQNSNNSIPGGTDSNNKMTNYTQQNSSKDYPPPKATCRLYALQGCYTYHDQQLQQKKKKMYPYSDQQQKSLSHDQHMVIHIVIHAVIRTTIGTFLIGYAIRSCSGIFY